MSSNRSGRTTINFGSLVPTGDVNEQMLNDVLQQFDSEVMRAVEKHSILKRRRSTINESSESSGSSTSLVNPECAVDQATQTSPVPQPLASANTSSSCSLRTPQSVAGNFGAVNYSWSSTDGSSVTPPEWELTKSRYAKSIFK